METRNKKPICADWHHRECFPGEFREELAGRAIFHWCCDQRMRRINCYYREEGKVVRYGEGVMVNVGWFCEVCKTREIHNLGML